MELAFYLGLVLKGVFLKWVLDRRDEKEKERGGKE